MLLILRVPPVGISAIGDLGDLASLFPCRDTGWIYGFTIFTWANVKKQVETAL